MNRNSKEVLKRKIVFMTTRSTMEEMAIVLRKQEGAIMLLSILSNTLIYVSYIVKTKNKSFASKPTFDFV